MNGINDNNNTDRLARQIAFLLEIDKLKSVLRRTYLINEPRHENSAEHSWHLAMAALILAEYANAPVDTGRVLKMLLVHDIVEIDAGDTYIYAVQTEKAASEEAAADRIFGLLPEDQRDDVRGLWEEFEARETSDAKFAAGLDRIMPILHNYHTEGHSWRKHGITRSQVLARNGHTAEGSEAIWNYILTVIDAATAKGYLIDDREVTHDDHIYEQQAMTITLTPELEEEFTKLAQEQGTTPEAVALNRLRRNLGLPAETNPPLPFEAQEE